VLPSGGDWTIRVYLMRSAARRGEQADYTLSVHIGGAAASIPASDFADGDAGGPDWWEVRSSGSLNIRSGPGTTYAVLGRAYNGQSLRNLGCRGAGEDRWCHVESDNGLLSGWAAGSFLHEDGSPEAPGSWHPDPDEAAAMGPDFWQVTGVPAGDYLNLRTGPGTSHSIVARASNGQTFRNLGCQGRGDGRWCHVQTADGRYDGWVSGAFLREGGSAPTTGSGITIPSGSALVPELNVRPTGETEAAWSSGCTVLYNPAGRRINAGSSCTDAQLVASDLWVARMNH
jgi:uncharacterized protein YraI